VCGNERAAAIKKEKDSGGSPSCAGVLVGSAIVHQEWLMAISAHI